VRNFVLFCMNIGTNSIRRVCYLWLVIFNIISLSSVNVLAQDPDLPPLINAILYKENNQIVKNMIDSSVDINLRDQRLGGSPLYYAVATENIEIVRYLINKGANINLQTFEYEYPLRVAELIRNNTIAAILKEAGATHLQKPSWLLLPYEVKGKGDIMNTNNLTLHSYEIKGNGQNMVRFSFAGSDIVYFSGAGTITNLITNHTIKVPDDLKITVGFSSLNNSKESYEQSDSTEDSFAVINISPVASDLSDEQRATLMAEILDSINKNFVNDLFNGDFEAVKKRTVAEFKSGKNKNFVEAFRGLGLNNDIELLQVSRRSESTGSAGVGLIVSAGEKYPIIIGTFETSSQLNIGDTIKGIGGYSTENMGLSDVIEKLKGEPGSWVKLLVKRVGEQPDEIVRMKSQIFTNTDRVEVEKFENGIAGIRLNVFGVNTKKYFKSALEYLDQKEVKSIVLDLRNLKGGLAGPVIDIASAFLPESSIIYQTKSRNLKLNKIIKTTSKPVFAKPLKVAVLVGPGTLSTGEILAQALQDCRGAILVGQKSSGIGKLSSIYPLKTVKYDYALKMTTAYYASSKGKVIKDSGVIPDIQVEQNVNDTLDAQLNKALQYLGASNTGVLSEKSFP